jgi:hypothetical protein
MVTHSTRRSLDMRCSPMARANGHYDARYSSDYDGDDDLGCFKLTSSLLSASIVAETVGGVQKVREGECRA